MRATRDQDPTFKRYDELRKQAEKDPDGFFKKHGKLPCYLQNMEEWFGKMVVVLYDFEWHQLAAGVPIEVWKHGGDDFRDIIWVEIGEWKGEEREVFGVKGYFWARPLPDTPIHRPTNAVND